MNTFQITTFTGSLQNQPTLLINARELHGLLQVKTPFKKWIDRRLSDTPFKENFDFIEQTILSNRGFFKAETIDYHLSLEMAKHLCLMENNEIGYQIRQKFIENDNKARIELPQLRAKVAQLEQRLSSVPAFMLPENNLDLLRKAQKALFTAYPECEKIMLYRDMGLENSEICKLLDLGRRALEIRLRKLFDLGLVQRKATNSPYLKQKQLALGLNG